MDKINVLRLTNKVNSDLINNYMKSQTNIQIQPRSRAFVIDVQFHRWAAINVS